MTQLPLLTVALTNIPSSCRSRTGRSRFSPVRVSGQGLLWALVLIVGVGDRRPAQARPEAPIHLAQGVTNQLPPPPPFVPFGDPPTSIPGQTVPDAQQRFNQGGSAPAAEATQYLVYVHGNSPLLLEQVQAVEPSAFQRTYDGLPVIQAGLFGDTDRAEDRVQALQNEGIGAQIQPIQVASRLANDTLTVLSPSSPETAGASRESEADFGSAESDIVGSEEVVYEVSSLPVEPPAFNSDRTSGSAVAAAPFVTPNASPYWIAIPATRSEVNAVLAQVTLAGVRPAGVEEDKNQRGRFVRVGPFVDRTAAERWNRYLRDLGMDARVHYSQ